MTPIKRPLAAAGAAALFALTLTACGGAPADASVKDFCKVTQDSASNDEFFKAIEKEDWDKVEELIKEQADEVEEVGTPEDISDEEREGFEIQLEAAKSVSSDDIKKAFEDEKDPFEEEYSKDDKKAVEAYNEYESKTCAGEGGEEGDSGEGTDPGTSTELPSDLPTDVPSDISTEDIPSIDPEQLESLLSDLPTEVPSS